MKLIQQRIGPRDRATRQAVLAREGSREQRDEGNYGAGRVERVEAEQAGRRRGWGVGVKVEVEVEEVGDGEEDDGGGGLIENKKKGEETGEDTKEFSG